MSKDMISDNLTPNTKESYVSTGKDNKKYKSKKSNDNKDSSKERRTLNISLQKRHIDTLNSIIDNWDDDGLVVSNEVCKSILFRNDFENNPFLQTFLSTFNLIKTNISSKDLFGKTYDEALNSALKSILNIKINASELVSLLENDSYFKPVEEQVISNRNLNYSDVAITESNSSLDDNYKNTILTPNAKTLDTINLTKDVNITNENNIDSKDEEDNTKNNDSSINNSTPLVWTIPEPINPNKNNSDNVDKRFDAFEYNF